MYTLREPFRAFGPDGQPSGIEVERSSNFPHLHSRVTGDGYALSCLGNRHLLTSPALRDFTLEVTWYCTLTSVMPADFGILFRYDPVTRTGAEIGFAFGREDDLSVQLFSVDGLTRTPVGAAAVIRGAKWEEKTKVPLTVCVEGDCVSGQIGGHVFALTGVPLVRAGQVGFMRRNFIGEWVLCDAVLTSPDEIPEETVLPEAHVFLPQTDGGTIPYELYCSVVRRGERLYLDYTFDGGPPRRHKYYPPLEKSGQYSGEVNTFTDPYVRVYLREGPPRTAYLKNGLLTVTDPNLQWKKALDTFWESTELPVSGTLPLPEGAEPAEIAFGYAFFTAGGHQAQENGPREYLFAPDGTYLGADLHDERFELLSPVDKEAVRMIPETCYDYPTVRKHFEENHYFSETEDIDLTLRVSGVADMRYVRAEAELQDAFASPMETLDVTARDGCFAVRHAPLPVGVYRIEYRVYRGEALLRTVNHAFEVFDPTGKRCAPTESGLPFLYSTPNEQRYLDRDSFDPWNPMPSCDVEHYFPCCCMTGVYGEKKRIWEILPLFGRKWYVWLTSRTMNDTEIDHHTELVRHADYLITQFSGRLYGFRTDYWKAEVYKGPLGQLLDRFLAENPQYAAQLSYRPGGEPITRPQLAELLRLCGHAWYDFANDEITGRIKEENERIRALNPNSRRACYGPFAIYTTIYASYYCIEKFGFPIDDRLSDDIFTGFAQFEDYPASCAYHTYRAAWAVMTIRLHIPRLRIYPEQYRSARGGCVDGAVKFAAPPMGARSVPEYYQNTHAREFVWNTPGFTGDGFVYWDDRGFMKRSFSWPEIDAYARGWKSIRAHRPLRPMRGTAFLADYDASDDRVEEDIYPGLPWLNVYNISEANQGYLYERLRESGVPGGFALKWDALDALTPELTDLLVLPSMAAAPAGAAEKIRALYAAGVSLLAASDVTGLEDLFGVRREPCTKRIHTLTAGRDRENVFPIEAEFRYAADGAETRLEADGLPVVLTYGRTALINSAVCDIGRDSFAEKVEYVRESVSLLLRRETTAVLRALTDPAAHAEGCGLTHFIDTEGRELLFAVDYSPYNLKDPLEMRNACVIRFSEPVRDVVSADGTAVNRLRGPDGRVEAAEIVLRGRESALLEVLR